MQKRGVRHQDTASSLVVTNVQLMKHDGVLEEDNNGFTAAGASRDGAHINGEDNPAPDRLDWHCTQPQQASVRCASRTSSAGPVGPSVRRAASRTHDD